MTTLLGVQDTYNPVATPMETVSPGYYGDLTPPSAIGSDQSTVDYLASQGVDTSGGFVSGDSISSNPSAGSSFNVGDILKLGAGIVVDVSSVFRTLNSPAIVPYGTTTVPGARTITGQPIYTSPPTTGQALISSGSLNYLVLGGLALVVLVLVLALRK